MIKHSYRNPFYHWWKARKYFKRPRCHIHIGKPIWFFGLYLNKEFYNPIINIKFSSLGWKTKYDEVRHEWDPFIEIMLFRKFQILFRFNWVTKKDRDSHIRSMATWEALLEYLYQNKSIQECIKDNIWSSGLTPSKDDITIHKNLKNIPNE